MLPVAHRDHAHYYTDMSAEVIRVGEPRPAGFWVRAAAFIIDLIVLWLVRRSYLWVTAFAGIARGDVWRVSPTLWLFTLLFAAAYATVLHATHGQTIGKNLLRIRVIGADGRRLALGTALLRWIGYWFSILPLGLGYVMAGLRRDKRALHDLIAGTRVERVPAGT